MDVNVRKQDDGVTIIEVVGRIDASTHASLQEVIDALDESTRQVVFDFKDVTYISSAGMRVLVAAGKKFGARNVRIVNVVPENYEVFHMAGIDTLFEVVRADEDVSTYINYSFKDVLATKCQKSADANVLKHLGRTYSWREVEACAQIVAHDLFLRGVRKGTHVGIISANSANWVICFFAVQKLGAVACLMNFNYSMAEIANAARVGDITHLCVGDATARKDFQAFADALVGDDDCPVESVYDIASSINLKDRLGEYAGVEGLFDGKVESDDVCVMIYTSGSTGVPKGVLLSAYNVLNAAETQAQLMKITNKDRMCLILPLFHIFGLNACLFANLLRNCIVIIPDSIKTDTVLATIHENRCTLFNSVPTMVLAIMANKAFDPSKVASLRATILAGAAATEAQIIRMREVFPGNHFLNAYGLSEMAPVSMTALNDTVEHLTTTVGKPLSNIRIKVVDVETGEDVPAGESGEIVVEGFNLMTCYYKADLDLQAVDSEGWLHTGDLGFIAEDGYLHLTGRAKELIIRGGENIMPSEIAEAISQFEGVRDVKVQGVPDDFYGEVVGASVIMQDGETLDRDALAAFLASRIAKYKIPAFVYQFGEFPMLSNGKVDAVNLKKTMNAMAAAERAR